MEASDPLGPGAGLASEDGVYFVSFSPDSSLLASGGHDEQTNLRDANSGELLRQIAHGEGTVYAARFLPRGGILASAGANKQVALSDPNPDPDPDPNPTNSKRQAGRAE